MTAAAGSLSSAATGTVNYNQGSSGQAVPAANYGNLTFSNFNKALPAATVGISGTFTPGTATGHTITGNTINFNSGGTQTIPAFNYNNLTSSGAVFRNLASSGTIGIASVFSPGGGLFTTTGSTVDFNGVGAQTIPSINYNNLVTSTSGVKTTGGTFTVNGNATVGAGTTLLVASGTTLTVTGTLTNNNVIQGTGTIANNFSNAGTVAPGLSPGILNITGTYANPGTLNIEIGGTAGAGVNPNGHDQLLITGAATLGGTLNVTLTNGFTPAGGNSFLILDAASSTGTFATTNLPNIAPLTWSVIYNNAAGTVTLNVVAPVAASVSISGRVMTPEGRGLRNAVVELTDTNGQTRMTRTSTFGYYRFDEIEVGQTIVLSVRAKRYQFNSQVVSVSENLEDVNFTAIP